MTRRNLLLCFDAFGTLFKPKQTVAIQYGGVARQLGLGGFSDEELQTSLLAAIKRERKARPNYGKASGIGASKWWTNVIRETFTPLLPPGKLLPDQLATRLLDRFSSADGYILTEPRLPHLLRILKGNSPQRVYDNIVIGVVTNSDDRVPGILSSLGVLVSPFRYGTPINRELPLTIPYEIDFHCMSYDVGCEKPDRRIFEAAEEMLGAMLQTRARPESDGSGWDKLYVGDEYEKDAKAALAAGWAAALLGENGPPSVTDNAVGTLHHHDHQHDPPDAILTGRRIVVVKSIGTLVEWLIGRSLLGGRE